MRVDIGIGKDRHSAARAATTSNDALGLPGLRRMRVNHCQDEFLILQGCGATQTGKRCHSSVAIVVNVRGRKLRPEGRATLMLGVHAEDMTDRCNTESIFVREVEAIERSLDCAQIAIVTLSQLRLKISRLIAV